MDKAKTVTNMLCLVAFTFVFITFIGFASSLYISTPKAIGLGSAVVESTPVKVVKANWLLYDKDPSQILGVMVHFRSVDGSAHDVTVYVALKDSSGTVICQAKKDVRINAEGETPIKFYLHAPAEKVAYLAITVLGG